MNPGYSVFFVTLKYFEFLLFSSLAAVSQSSCFIIADTTQSPSISVPFKISQLSLFNPPIAPTGMDTCSQMSCKVSTFVRTVFYFCSCRINCANTQVVCAICLRYHGSFYSFCGRTNDLIWSQ